MIFTLSLNFTFFHQNTFAPKTTTANRNVHLLTTWLAHVTLQFWTLSSILERKIFYWLLTGRQTDSSKLQLCFWSCIGMINFLRFRRSCCLFECRHGVEWEGGERELHESSQQNKNGKTAGSEKRRRFTFAKVAIGKERSSAKKWPLPLFVCGPEKGCWTTSSNNKFVPVSIRFLAEKCCDVRQQLVGTLAALSLRKWTMMRWTLHILFIKIWTP